MKLVLKCDVHDCTLEPFDIDKYPALIPNMPKGCWEFDFDGLRCPATVTDHCTTFWQASVILEGWGS